MSRQIYAHYDAEGVFVYQAFKPSIVDAALKKGTFGTGFGLERMTWIKPSFGWMLYRSGYATKHRQERILKIKISHEGWLAILGQAIPTSYVPELFESEFEWSKQLKRSDVRIQWDPDRDLRCVRLERRAIQVGIRGESVQRYVNSWILGLEDVTGLAHELHERCQQKRTDLPVVPEERVYQVSAELAQLLGISVEGEG